MLTNISLTQDPEGRDQELMDLPSKSSPQQSPVEREFEMAGYRELTELYQRVPDKQHLNNPRGLRNVRNIVGTLALNEQCPPEEYMCLVTSALVPASEANKRGMPYAIYGK